MVAPFDGTVAQVNLELNEMAPMNLPAVVLVDLSGFYVDVSVDELDVIFVEEGQGVVLTLERAGRRDHRRIRRASRSRCDDDQRSGELRVARGHRGRKTPICAPA